MLDDAVYDDLITCTVCFKDFNSWDNQITTCPNCGEPVCANCSEGLSDMYYGWCNNCMGGNNS